MTPRSRHFTPCSLLLLASLCSCSSSDTLRTDEAQAVEASEADAPIGSAPSAFDLVEHALGVAARQPDSVQLLGLNALVTTDEATGLATTRLVIDGTFSSAGELACEEVYARFMEQLADFGTSTEVSAERQSFSLVDDELHAKGMVVVSRGRSPERARLDDEGREDLSRMVRMVSVARGLDMGPLDIRFGGASSSRVDVRPGGRSAHDLDTVRAFFENLQSREWGLRVTALGLDSQDQGAAWSWKAQVRG